ncbi:MAG TPA: hypothetical protein VL305_01275 [Pseudolabrys sp.]|jgi:hypothetical protein|nr:hypothetical protein [Pseudolabrys sp.]
MGMRKCAALGTKLTTLFTAALLLSGCWGNFIPSLRQPDRLFTADEEIQALRKGHLESPTPATVEARNDFITSRMYAIDLAYTQYESQLTHESQDIGFLTTVSTLALTGTAALIPVGQTSRVLSGIASGVTGTGAAYNEKILMSNLIQNLEGQMRTDRNDQAAIIYQNMKCDMKSYPVGLALTDLEAYYRAGTLSSALIGLNKTVGKAETMAKANKESKNPASPESAKVELTTSAKVSEAKASPGSTKPSGKCEKAT